MKPKLTFILSLTLLFLFSGSVYGQEEREVRKSYNHQTGYLWNKIQYKNGKKDGLEIWYDFEKPGENIVIKTHWKNGKRDGLATWWWRNGKKKNETHWKNGKKVKTTFWKESGEMEYIKEYDKDGHFMSQRDFVDGVEVINPY